MSEYGNLDLADELMALRAENAKLNLELNEKDAKIVEQALENVKLQEKLNGMLHCSEAYDAMAKLCSETEWTLNEKIEALRAENARLREERDNALHRAAEYRDKCNSLSNENRALRAARKALGESDE